jgi:hypothetical protein
MDRGAGEQLFGDMVDTTGIGWRAAEAIQGVFAVGAAGGVLSRLGRILDGGLQVAQEV